jgi:predicted Zn-dependent protease
MAAKYGLACVALKRGDPVKAQELLQEARVAQQSGSKSIVLDYLGIDILLAAGKAADAVKLADAARNQFPLSRGLARRYAETLLAAGRTDQAITYLRDQAQLYRHEAALQDLLAKAYSAGGKVTLQHLALAESYAQSGSLPAALDQLGIARRSADASFYDQSLIDARERDYQQRWKEEVAEVKKDK